MTPTELDHTVARVLGESTSADAQTDFVLPTPILIDREPMMVDWDRLDEQRVSVFLQRVRRQTDAA